MALGAMLLDALDYKTSIIEINNLFGIYNYRIDNVNKNKISIIFGHNGQGKTTIFKLIDSVLDVYYEEMDDIYVESIKLTFESGKESNNLKKELSEIKYYPDISFINTHNFEMRKKIINIVEKNSINNKLKIGEFVYNNKVFPILLNCDKFVDNNYIFQKKDLLYDKIGLLRLLIDDNIQSPFYMSSDRVFKYFYNGRISGKELGNQFIIYMNELNKKIKKIIFDCKNNDKNYNLDDSKLKSIKKIANKNGWYTFSRDKSNYYNSLLFHEDFKRVELYFNILNESIFNQSNKRIGISNNNISKRKICLYYDKNGINMDDMFPNIEELTNKNIIPLEKLSSGEMNFMVLLYEVIFRVDRNKILLVDEPEISLHLSIQEQLLDIINNIINYDFKALDNHFKGNDVILNGIRLSDGKIIDLTPLNGIQVIVATHSPVICQNHLDKMIELK